MTNPDNTAIYHQIHRRMGPQAPVEDVLEIKEKVVKGEFLTGREVAQLKQRQHIFIRGRHAVVVDVNRRGPNVELVYVKGRKAFGNEIYMDVPFNDMKTVIQMGVKLDPGNIFLPEPGPKPKRY